MAGSKKAEKKVVDRIFGSLGIIAALILLVIGIVCWKSGSNIVTTVDNNLKAQQVYFPTSGNPAFSAAVYPAAQKYAGQLVDTGKLAQAYANDYLGPQINLVGGGKTLSQITAEEVADPQNPQVQELQGTMFQLVTTQSVMLTGVYGDWSQGTNIKDIGGVAFVAALALILTAGAQLMQYKRLR